MWVGPDLIIPDKEYASLKTAVMALELIPTSKRLLSNDIPQGNTKLPRSRAAPGKHNPQPNPYMIGMSLSNLQSMERAYHWVWA